MVHTRARRDHPIKISAMSVPTGNIGEYTSKRVLACKDIVPLLRISASFADFGTLSAPIRARHRVAVEARRRHGHRDAPPVNCVVQPRPVRECTHSGAASIDVGYEHTVLRSAATKLDGAAAARGRLQPGDAPWRRSDDHAARRAERVDACYRPLDPVL